jgi:sugar-specific transcriptional regulator TrmB
MEGLAEARQRLLRLGLTPNQAAIYLVLVTYKELRIQDIARLAHLPRSTVYEGLKKLYKLGLAEEVVNDHFKTVRPYPLGVIRHGLQDKISNLQKLAHDLDSVEEAIQIATARAQPSATTIRYYKDRAGARQIFWNSLKTNHIVYVYSEWGRGTYVGMKFYERFVAESRDRGIKERVLINPTPHALESIRKYTFPGSTIARTSIEDIRAVDEEVMAIKGETLIYDVIFAQVYLKTSQINGFEVESQAFSQSQRSLYESLWERATPIRRFL